MNVIGDHCEPASMVSRYPSPAELDAFAHKTASSPLSIKIFPSDVRVPQHKQLNKTVNGLDTTGQRYSQYSQPYSGGYQGLLAIVKASVGVRGVLKNCEGKRTKHGNNQSSVAPYSNPLNNGVRHGQKTYHSSSCKPPDVPIDTLCSSAGMASGDPSLGPRSELAKVQSLMRHMSRIPHSQAPEPRGGGGPSQPVCAGRGRRGSFPLLGLCRRSATPDTDMAKAAYLDKGDYSTWKQKHHHMQAPYQQGAVRMYGVGNGSVQGHGAVERGGASSLTCATVTGDFPVAPYFTPLWDNMVSTPNSDCYTSQVLATGICAAYSADQNLTCGLPSSGLCHAAVLSSSLQSLECLIGEIHPPCIKERMLGRGYEAMGMPLLLEHHQHTNIQLPVYR
uniref:Family with sequence similarity 222 member A n=1 Tax=Sphaeramia orbicularis TaxID=375764 RepID=A0A672ZG90_9TELE